MNRAAENRGWSPVALAAAAAAVAVLVVIAVVGAVSARRYEAFLGGYWVGDPGFLERARLKDMQLFIAPERAGRRQGYLLMTDLDYIIPRDAIDSALTLTEDKMRFKRQFGVLQPDGSFTQDLDVLRTYGLSEQRILERGTRLAPHPNNFVMRKEAFWRIGGYREDLVDRPYPNKGDTYFKRAWAQAYERGELTLRDSRPTLYMFPSGQWCGDVDADPLGLFHTLTRKTPNNHWYTHQRYAP